VKKSDHFLSLFITSHLLRKTGNIHDDVRRYIQDLIGVSNYRCYKQIGYRQLLRWTITSNWNCHNLFISSFVANVFFIYVSIFNVFTVLVFQVSYLTGTVNHSLHKDGRTSLSGYEHHRHKKYKVVQIWPGLFVCKQVTVCPGHI
jgi:hypothetical protein